MKKLLLVAGAGLVGIYVAKKVVNKMKAEKEVQEIIEQAEELVNEEVEVNEEIIENVEEEIVVDNDEEIEVEIVDDIEVEENDLADNIKGFVINIVKAPIRLVVKACGFVSSILIKINKRLNNVKEIDRVDLAFMGNFEFYCRQAGLILGGLVIDINRRMVLILVKICKLLNKLL